MLQIHTNYACDSMKSQSKHRHKDTSFIQNSLLIRKLLQTVSLDFLTSPDSSAHSRQFPIPFPIFKTKFDERKRAAGFCPDNTIRQVTASFIMTQLTLQTIAFFIFLFSDF